MALKKIKALTNVGSSKFRMLTAGRTITMDDSEIDEGIMRLWRSRAISIDGVIHGDDDVKPEKKEEVAVPVPDAPIVPDAPAVTDAPVVQEEVEAPVPQEEEVPASTEPTEPEEPEEPQNENAPDEKTEDTAAVTPVISKEALMFIESKPAGFFGKDQLDTMNLEQLRKVGDEIGVDIKTRKKGLDMIVDEIERIMSA